MRKKPNPKFLFRKSRREVKSVRWFEDDSFAATDLGPAQSGLRGPIWMSCIMGSFNLPHLWVQGSDGKRYPVSVEEPIRYLVRNAPGFTDEDIAQLEEFIRLNRIALMSYWNLEASTAELLNEIILL